MNKILLFGCAAALAASVASAEADWHGTAAEAKATPHWMIESAQRAVDTNEVVVRGLNCPDVPFLVGEMGTLPKDRTGMNPILAAAGAVIPHAALVKASDLTGHLPDNIHFDTPSYAILGVRYYDAWKRLSEGCQKRRVLTDVLRSAELSAFRCPAARSNEISRTFLLTNGVLVALPLRS